MTYIQKNWSIELQGDILECVEEVVSAPQLSDQRR
jgi:hypothetical protein